MPTNSDNLSPTKRVQLAYWTAFCEYMARHSPIPYRLELDPEKPTYWVQFPEELFRRGAQIRLGAHIIIRGEKYISVVLHLRGPKAKQRFDSLLREKEPIEKEIGAEPDWQRRGQEISEIIVKNPDVDPKNERDWRRQHDWLMKNLEAFYMAFAPRIRRL